MPLLKSKALKYLGYLIYKCYGSFDDAYCTVVNPVTKGHIHVPTVKVAKVVCRESRYFEKYGRFSTRSFARRNQASRLALRMG